LRADDAALSNVALLSMPRFKLEGHASSCPKLQWVRWNGPARDADICGAAAGFWNPPETKGNSFVTENPYSPTADSFTLGVIHREE